MAFVAHAAVHLVVPAAMGAGDVKLAAPLGAVLAAASWEALALGGLLAAVLSGGLAAVLALTGRGRRRTGAAARPGDAAGDVGGGARRGRRRRARAVSCTRPARRSG